MDRDPFDEVQPAYRTGDHETSMAAAEAVAPVSGKIARWVLAYAAGTNGSGFTDDELKAAQPYGTAESSYRKRRSELTAGGYLKSCGDQRKNRLGRLELVWRITEQGRAAL